MMHDGNEEADVRKIKGIVLDEKGAPLPGASIQVIGTTIGAGTNTLGEFSLSLQSPKWLVLAGPVLWATRRWTIPPPNTTTRRIVIRLCPTLSSLDEIVVTGTRSEKPLEGGTRADPCDQPEGD